MAVGTSSNDYAKELALREFGSDPEMVRIIECESSFRQFNSRGGVLTNFNKNKTFDVGIMQINSIHEPEALEKGFDLNTPEGNVAMARVIYDRDGKDAWVCRGSRSLTNI